MDQKMYIINKDEDDEMKVYCYKLSKVKTFVTYLMFFLTCGILRLIFHWIPHWFLYATSDKCDINEAEKVLITVSTQKCYKNSYFPVIQSKFNFNWHNAMSILKFSSFY